MPYTSTIGRHSCRIHLPYDGPGPMVTCYSASRNVFARTWPADPAEVTAAVTFHGVPFGDLLCGTQDRGCAALYSGLVAKGLLP